MASGGRTAVIIGASSGIGEALACELHQTGWCLGLCTSDGQAETLAEQLGAGCTLEPFGIRIRSRLPRAVFSVAHGFEETLRSDDHIGVVPLAVYMHAV